MDSQYAACQLHPARRGLAVRGKSPDRRNRLSHRTRSAVCDGLPDVGERDRYKLRTGAISAAAVQVQQGLQQQQIVVPPPLAFFALAESAVGLPTAAWSDLISAMVR